MTGEGHVTAAELVVVGAGGMGREAAAWTVAARPDDRLLGILDGDPALHGTTVAQLPVLGDLDWLADHPQVQVVLGLGVPATRMRVVAQLDEMESTLATVIHPTVTVGPRTLVAEGAILCPGVLLTSDVHVGRAAIVNYGAMVGHDGHLGEGCFIAPGAHLAGNVTVGAQADVGIGASIIQGVHVGERAVVGAGAVVIDDVPPDTTVVGVPARPLPRKHP